MFAVIHLPQFSLQAVLRHGLEDWTKAVALVDPEATTPRVGDLTIAAQDHGVEKGLTPTQALARCRSVSIRHRSRTQETALTDALLQTAYHFSPHIENTTAGLVTLDLRGLAELAAVLRPSLVHESPADEPGVAAKSTPRPETSTLANWAHRLRDAVTSLNIRTCIGIGPTPNIARHAALWTECETSPGSGLLGKSDAAIHIVTDAPTFIAALPVAALDPSTDVAGILQKWGIRTVGQLLALGQDALMDRLGLEAIALFAAASTQTLRPLHLVRPAESYEESYEFENPVETAEPLLFLLNRFAGQLSHRLHLSGLAAGQLVLQLRLETGECLQRTLPLPQPTHRADVLFRMLQTHLENLRTDAPIVELWLRADPTRPEQKQFSLFEVALRDPQQFQETLARLSALVGAGRVGTPVRENSHRPDAFQLVPPDFENAPDVVSAPRQIPALLRQAPLRRLRPALPAEVQTVTDPNEASSSPSQRGSHSKAPSSIAALTNRARPGNIVELLGPLFTSTASEHSSLPPRSGTPLTTPAAKAANVLDAGEHAITRGHTPEIMPATPISIHCAVARGKLVMALGPWRASGRWWEPGSWQREEWDVQTNDGQALRLTYGNGAWEVEAILD